MGNRIGKLVALKGDTPLAAQSKQQGNGATLALLTPEQFASVTGIGIYTVRIWIRQGIICSLPVGTTGRVRRIPSGEVERIRGLHGNGTTASVQKQG
jgi:hypothetical protein